MTNTVDSPAPSDYWMPAEWHRHVATWLSWPRNVDTWPRNLESAQEEFSNLVASIARDEKVYLMAGGDAMKSVVDRFSNTTDIEILDVPTNDAWIRDYGPTFVFDKQTNASAIVDWGYNAWGGKYPPFDFDQSIAKRAAELLGMDRCQPGIILEGGAIEINSNGVMLVTQSCLVDDNRNPGLTRQELEPIVRRFTGANHVLWLPGDGGAGKCIEADDTDGHIDQLARFVNDDTIVYASTGDETRNEFLPLQENLAPLKTALELVSLDMNLIPLPLPDAVSFAGARLPASYCNFYITNGSVIVPQFGVPQDGEALEILRPFFPSRRVIGLPSNNLSVGLGSFHCLTQQQPVGNQAWSHVKL